MDYQQKTEIMVKTEEIKNTPFVLITDEENDKCFAVCGNIRVTDYHKINEKKKVIQEVNKPTWEKIIAVIKKMIDYESKK